MELFSLCFQVCFSTLDDAIKSVVSLIQLSKMCGNGNIFFFHLCMFCIRREQVLLRQLSVKYSLMFFKSST